jgi:hypothetical protein
VTPAQQRPNYWNCEQIEWLLFKEFFLFAETVVLRV